jgi:hypothetical protein
MKLKYPVLCALLLLFFNGFSQDFFNFTNPNYTLKKEKEAFYKYDIFEANLQESSPYFMLERLALFGIDAKKQKIKTITSKNFHFIFDPNGNLILAGFGKKPYKAIPSMEYTYNDQGLLIKTKGFSFNGHSPIITDFLYDSINRLRQVKVVIYNDKRFIEIPTMTHSFYNQYEYDGNKVTTIYDGVIPAKYSTTGKDYKQPPISYVYDTSNRIIKRFTGKVINDSIIYYTDSIIKYHYEYEIIGAFSRDKIYPLKTLHKLVYNIKNNNIVSIGINNKPPVIRKFNDKNTLIEEDENMVKYKYDSDGRLMRDDLIYNEQGLLTGYLFVDKMDKIHYTFY